MRIEYTTSSRLLTDPVYAAPVVVAMPATDLALAERAAQLMARRAGVDGLVLVVMDEARVGFIEATNRAFRGSDGEFFVYTAQDAFAGRLWLKVALHQMERQDKDMMAFNDGKWHGLLASFGLVRRRWAQQHYGGALFHPSYHSHYGDAELTLIAKAHDRLGYAARSVLVEVDWEKDDKLVNDHDKKHFRQRAKACFDGLVPTRHNGRILPSAPSTLRTADPPH